MEPTYNNGYYNGYDQAGHLRAAGGALDGNKSYAMSPGDGDCARRYRSYDPASGTYVRHDGRHHSCQQTQGKAPELVCGGAGSGDRRTRWVLEAAGCLGGFQLYVTRDRDFIATSEFRRI